MITAVSGSSIYPLHAENQALVRVSGVSQGRLLTGPASRALLIDCLLEQLPKCKLPGDLVMCRLQSHQTYDALRSTNTFVAEPRTYDRKRRTGSASEGNTA